MKEVVLEAPPAHVAIGVNYRVAIRFNVTLEVRETVINQPWGPGSLEWWTEGAMSCDCARAEVFALAAEDDDSPRCEPYCQGRGILFDVLYVDLADGRRVPIDVPLVLH